MAFTAPVSTGATGFGFNLAGTSAFSKPATSTTATGFSGFGGTGSSLFSGAAKTTAAPTLGTSTASTGFGFGKPATSFGFGTPASTAASTTGFGATGAFGKPAATTTGFGTTSTFGKPFGTTGFGTTTTSSGGLFATASQPLQTTAQTGIDDKTKLLLAVHDPQLPVTDKEKATIKRWNQLQALWGAGKGFATSQDQVTFTAENPFAYFKAVGYSFVPKSKDEDGLVALIVDKPLTNPEQDQKEIMDELNKLVAGTPQLSFIVDSIRQLPDNKTELVIYIQEKLPNGTVKRVTASMLHKAMVGIAAQLQTKKVVQCIPKASMSDSALQYYLSNPPAGVDKILWEQAKKDNPDKANLLPVPIIGFSEIQKRKQHQQQQCDAHQSRLNVMESEIKKLQQTHATTLVTLEQHKRRHLNLSHRLLSVIVRQEVMRKKGFTMSEHEEVLRNKLDSLHQELNAPTQFKSRLNELLSQIRLQNQALPGHGLEQTQLDESMLKEIKEHLAQQQKGLKELIDIVKDDMSDLGLIESGYMEGSQR